jgi:hypothetical protein
MFKFNFCKVVYRWLRVGRCGCLFYEYGYFIALNDISKRLSKVIIRTIKKDAKYVDKVVNCPGLQSFCIYVRPFRSIGGIYNYDRVCIDPAIPGPWYDESYYRIHGELLPSWWARVESEELARI